jgi:hypothetical protein
MFTASGRLQPAGRNSAPAHDPYFNSVPLLAHCDDFTDVAGNVLTSNSVTVDSTTHKFGGNSWNFPGVSQYVSIPANSGFSFGTGDFTIELWVYVPSWTNNTNGKMMLDSRPNSTNGAYWNLGLTSIGRAQFTTLTSGGVNVTAPSIIPTAQWVHVAVTRASGRIDLWINGTSVANATGNTDNISSSGLRIGRNAFAPSDSFWSGNMDDIRITKGVARYTANFTPPSAAFPNGVDSHFSQVAALLHMNGTNGGTTFTDVKGHTFTATGATTSTTQSKFNGSSGSFSSAYIASSASPDFAGFGGGDFTLEAWVHPTAFANFETLMFVSAGVSNSWTANHQMELVLNSSGQVLFGYSNGTSSEQTFTATGGSLTLNTWQHVAVVKQGTTITVYLNGASVGSTTVSMASISANCRVTIGRTDTIVTTPNNYYSGYLAEVRLTKVARYTAAFSVPFPPFPNS